MCYKLGKGTNTYQIVAELCEKTCELISNLARTRHQQQEFTTNLDNLFDIAHADALQLIRIEEDKIFLQHHRNPGRPGNLA